MLRLLECGRLWDGMVAGAGGGEGGEGVIFACLGREAIEHASLGVAGYRCHNGGWSDGRSFCY